MEQHLSVGTDEPSRTSTEINASPFEKYNPLLHGGVSSKPSRAKGGGKKKGAPKTPEVLTIAFVKKYIQYAKNTIQPILTPEASEVITKAWTNLRNDDAGPTRKRVCFLFLLFPFFPISLCPKFLSMGKKTELTESQFFK